MRAVITGVAGFAGSFLAEHLLACGAAVLGTSLDGRWPADSSPELSRHAEILPWNVAAGIPDDVLERVTAFAPEAIFHLAAISIPADCGRIDPTPQALQVNVGGTEAVVRLAAQCGARPRVMLISSSRVYAPVDPTSPLVSETSPLGPTSGYAKTKLAAEEVLRREATAAGLEFLVIRAFNHAGPRQSPKLMLSQWCRNLVRGDDPLEVLGLDSYLDMTDVRDVVRAYRLLMLHGQPGETYNVGGGVALRSGDIFEQLRQMYDPARRYVERSPGRQQDPIADLTKLQRTIEWRPEISLEKTLRDTLDYWIAKERASRMGGDWG